MDLDTHVCIIGAGMSGLCTAIQLIRQYNTRKFIIIEKSPELAGTWGVNTYPGCGCDVSDCTTKSRTSTSYQSYRFLPISIHFHSL